MKIAVIGYPLLHKRQYSLFQKMKEHEIHIIAPRTWPAVTYVFEKIPPSIELGLKLHLLPDFFQGDAIKYFMPDSYRIIKKIKPDLIYTQAEPWTITCFYSQFIANRLKIPFIFFTWDNIYKRFWFLPRLVEGYSIKGAKGIIAGNRGARKVLLKKGATCKIAICPQSGIDIKLFLPGKANLRSRLGLKDKKVVLFAGRFVPEKGIYQILGGIKNIKKEVGNVHYIFCGRGPEQQKMLRFIRKNNLSGNCTIMNWIPYDEMPRLYNTADVFVYPSYATKNWKEQFGFAILEAMSCGVPVVATKSGAIPEVVGNAAVLIEEKNRKKLTKSIVKILRDNELHRELSRKVQILVRRKFDLKIVAEKHLNFFEEVIKKG